MAASRPWGALVGWLVLASVGAGCQRMQGGGAAEDGGGGSSVDLATAADLGANRDLATVADLGATPDLEKPVDLASASDLTMAPVAPTGVMASDGTSSAQVTVTWSASPTATANDVYRDGVKVATDLVATSYDDPGAGAGGVPSAPIGLAATDGSSTAEVQLTWGQQRRCPRCLPGGRR
jgi:hypothetical protein